MNPPDIEIGGLGVRIRAARIACPTRTPREGINMRKVRKDCIKCLEGIAEQLDSCIYAMDMVGYRRTFDTLSKLLEGIKTSTTALKNKQSATDALGWEANKAYNTVEARTARGEPPF